MANDDFLNGDGVFVGGSPAPPSVPTMDLDLGEDGYHPSDFVYGRDYAGGTLGANLWQKLNGILSPVQLSNKVAVGALTTVYDEMFSVYGRIYASQGLRLGNAATISLDGSNNIVFSDSIAGSVTLAQLLAAGTGNVSSTGTPVNGQLAQWTGASTIQGIDVSSLTLAQSQITGLVSALAGKASTIHNFIDTTNHPVSGLTPGQFLKVLSPTTYGFTAHGLTATDIGLGNVGNYAQVRKISSATNNAVVRWDGASGDLVKDSLMTVANDGTPNIPLGMTYNINGVPHTHTGSFQAVDATLTALAALDSSVGFIYQTGADVFTKYGFSGSGTATTVARSDHNHAGTYLTGNQSITLSGDATGSGTTAITVTLATVNANVYVSDTFLKFSVNAKGLVTSAAAVAGTDINTAFGSTTANYIYASPSGSAGTPTFRAMTSDDVPTLAQSKITNLVSDLSGKQSSSTILTTLSALANSTGYLYNNGSGTLSWAAASGGGDVSVTGTPTNGQLAQWTNATTIQGIAINSLATDGFGALTDVTTNNASTTAHGFLPKLNNNAAQYLNGQGAWTTPAGGGNVSTSGTITTGTIARWASSTSIESIANGTANYVLGMHATSGHEWKSMAAGSTKLSIAHAAGSITFDVVPANVDHNGLLNYSANRHIDHSAVSISPGTGLTGGGDLTTTRTLTVSYGTTAGTACVGNDSRLSDARTPLSHNIISSHTASGLTTGHFLKATSASTFSFAAHGLTYTDVGAAASSHTHAESSITFTDITTGNSTTGAHGYLPKLGGGTTNFLRADGSWAVPPGGSGTVDGSGANTRLAYWTDADTLSSDSRIVRTGLGSLELSNGSGGGFALSPSLLVINGDLSSTNDYGCELLPFRGSTSGVDHAYLFGTSSDLGTYKHTRFLNYTETLAWIDKKGIYTPNAVGARSFVWKYYPYSSSTVIAHDAEASTGATSYTKLKTITIGANLDTNTMLRLTFDLRLNTTGPPYAYGRIYRNGVAVGVARSTSSGSYVTYQEDITGWSAGDTIELWAYTSSGYTAYVRNFRILGTHNSAMVNEVTGTTS